MLHLQARQVAELDDLFGHAEGARDQGLRGDDRSHGGQQHHGQQGPVWRHHVEGVLDRLGVAQQQRALTEVVQRERRHDHAEPGQTHGPFAEVAQVGVQRLRAGHAQHQGAEDDEGGTRVAEDETQGVVRAQGPENGRVGGNLRHTQHADGCEPEQGDRAEELADACGAALLHGKQREQDDQGQRDHRLLEGGRDDLQAFDG